MINNDSVNRNLILKYEWEGGLPPRPQHETLTDCETRLNTENNSEWSSGCRSTFSITSISILLNKFPNVEILVSQMQGVSHRTEKVISSMENTNTAQGNLGPSPALREDMECRVIGNSAEPPRQRLPALQPPGKVGSTLEQVLLRSG